MHFSNILSLFPRVFFFFFNDTAPPEIYPLPLHAPLPISLAGVAPETPRVLLSHNPDLIEYLPAGLRVDVMLSGHTHNGQLHLPLLGPLLVPSQFGGRDRKSTRLNSSHSQISYAVFCLKKK